MKASDVADWLLDRGAMLSVSRADGKTVYWPESGFYKADGATFLKDGEDGGCYLHSRYGEVTKVETPWEVVRQSEEWHEFSKDRFSGWAGPVEPWASLYKQRLEAE